MKKLLTLLFSLFIGVALFSADANAKRFGGGKSFGKQREQISRPATPPAAAPAPVPNGARGGLLGGRSWLGPLAGLAAGGLLASLFMGHGFEGFKMFDFLLIAAIGLGIYFLIRKMRGTPPVQQTPLRYAGMDQTSPAPTTPLPGAATWSQPAAIPLANSNTRPAWFEDEPFLRAAKGHFIRLQTAYDKGDLSDIREYTTPEVFAEVQLQLQERGPATNKTDILELNASMLEVVTEQDLIIASVRFTGLIREEEGAAPVQLDEIWHIQKSATDRNAPWFVAGIQQAN